MSSQIEERKRSIKEVKASLEQIRRITDSRSGPLITQQELHRILTELAAIFWNPQLSSSDRNALRSLYLDLLKSIKLIADDLFIESFAAIKAPTPKEKQKKEEAIGLEYIATVQSWIKASPALDRQTASKLKFTPPKRLTNQLFRTSFAEEIYKPVGVLMERAKRALVREVKASRRKAARETKPFQLRLSDETVHLFGLTFLLLQLLLIEESQLIPPSLSDIEFWYKRVVKLVERMSLGIIDAIGVLERKALIDKQVQEANSYQKQRRSFLNQLASVYSIRSREAATLWSFLHRRRVGRRRMLQRKIVAPNDITVTEENKYIFSLPGRPNPDDQDNVGARSVDALLVQQAQLQGDEVRVFGLKRGSRTTRFFLHSIESTERVKVHFDKRPLPGAFARYVVVDGILNIQGGNPVIEAKEVDEFRVPYLARIGFSLLFPQLAEGFIPPKRRPPDLNLQPSWRKTTEALTAAAVEEWNGGEGESLPDSLAGQQALVTDLMHHDEIRDQFKSVLTKNNVLDLKNRDIRVRAWQTMLQKFRQKPTNQKSGKGVGLAELFELIQRYLTHYTRHTFWNIRDWGDNYLDGEFPQEISGKVLHDCGVYAIQVAYDLFLTINKMSDAGPIEFDFLVTADHVTLISYVGDQSFMVNNRRIEPPEKLPAVKKPRTPRGEALLQAVRIGYERVHNLKFNVVPFIKTLKPVSTNQSKESFKKEIWNAYLSVTAWGLAPAHSDQYYVDMHEFNRDSRNLQTTLDNIPKNARVAAPEVVQATNQATQLFQRAETLVDRCRFAGASRAFDPSQLGVSFLERPRTLPMYEVADALKKAQDRGENLSPDQQNLVNARPGHPIKLLKLWFVGSQRPCP